MLTSGWAGGRDTHEPWPYAGSAGVSSGRTTTNTRLENKEAPGITVRPSAVSPRCIFPPRRPSRSSTTDDNIILSGIDPRVL